jgi:hypothetical protein
MPNSYLSKKGYVIKKDSITVPVLKELKKELQGKPLVDTKFITENPSYPVYIETKTKMYIPKMFGINKFGFPENVLENYEGVSWENDIKFTGTLLERQIEPVNALLKACQEKGGGILTLNTGFGKTVCSIYLLSKLRGKTIIVVNKIPLMHQWKSEIETFLPGVKVGILQGKKIPDQDCDIVVAMLQSMTLIDYPDTIFNDFRITLIDECFPYNTGIITTNGNIYIGKLYYMHQQNKTLPMVKTFNQDTRQFEYKKIINVFRKTNDTLIEINCGKMKMKSTENHKYLTNNGWKEAINLTLNDYLIINYDKSTINSVCPSLNDDQYQILIGSFLGNGHISKLKNGRFISTMTHSKDQQDYCAWKANMFGIINTSYKRKKKVYQFYTRSFYLFDELPNPNPNSKTNAPQWMLDNLNEKGLAIWFMDNGIIIDKFDKDSQKRIIKKLQSMNNINTDYNINTEYNVKELIKLIHKYIPEKLFSKFEIFKDIPTEFCYKWNSKFLDYGHAKITNIVKNIKNYNKSKFKQNYVFDLEIQDNHNYIVRNKKYTKPNENGFVVHNCHNVSSKVFSQIFFKITSKYTIGLSATPRRADGCEYVFKWHIGEIAYEGKTERSGKPPIIRCLKIDTKEYKEISTINKFTGEKQLQFTTMLTDLVQMSKRNLLTIEIIKSLIKEERKILVIGDRREHLQTLNNLLDADPSITFTYGLFLGAMKTKDLDQSRTCDVILATAKAFGEGVSEKDLDTLLLVTPKKFIGHLKNRSETDKKESGKLNQLVGRIFRRNHIDKNPVIVDFFDNFSVYKNQSSGRKAFYKQHFTNAIFEDQSINLDENNNVNISFIKTKKSKEKIETIRNGIKNLIIED